MQSSSSPITTRRYFITGSQRLSNFFWASLIFLGGAGFLLTGFFSFLNRGTPSVNLVEQTGTSPQYQTGLPNPSSPLLSLHTKQSFVTPPLLSLHTKQSFVTPSLLSLHTKQSFVTPSVKENDNKAKLCLRSFQKDTYSINGKEGLKNLSFSILPLANSSIKFFPQGLIMSFYGCSALIFSLYLWLTIFWKVGNGFNEFNKETGVVRIFRWGLPGKNRQIDFSYCLKDIEALRVTLKEGINPRRTIALQIKGKGEIPLTRIGEPMALQDIENQASELANFLKIEIQVLTA